MFLLQKFFKKEKMSGSSADKSDLAESVGRIRLCDAARDKSSAASENLKTQKDLVLDTEEENFDYFWDENLEEEEVECGDSNSPQASHKEALFFTVKPILEENKLSKKAQDIIDEFKKYIESRDNEKVEAEADSSSSTHASTEDAVFYKFKRVIEKKQPNNPTLSTCLKRDLKNDIISMSDNDSSSESSEDESNNFEQEIFTDNLLKGLNKYIELLKTPMDINNFASEKDKLEKIQELQVDLNTRLQNFLSSDEFKSFKESCAREDEAKSIEN